MGFDTFPPQRPLRWLGYLLVLVWLGWWSVNLANGRMAFAARTWIHLPAFGVDFTGHVDRSARTWMAGGDPYQTQERRFSYPPVVTRLFMWVTLTSTDVSLRIWIGCAALFAALGAYAAVRWRDRLHLEPLPASFGIAAILFSTPVLFALERANYDLLIVPCMVGALLLADKKHPTAVVFAGLLFAIAAWAKIYPGLLIVGLMVLKRWQLAAWMIGWCILIGLIDLPGDFAFMRNIGFDLDETRGLARWVHEIHPWNHPLGMVWPDLWSGTPLVYLPGEPGALLLIGALVAWVSWHVWRAPARDLVAMPFLFWIVAAATFIPGISNDYNLTPLPLAVLALWSLRYRWWIHAGLVALALWWQPIALPLPGRAVLFFKIAGLIATGAMLVAQTKAPARPIAGDVSDGAGAPALG